ncbi:MAG: AAA family ATPase [Planctomycetes bacterium]|nr:AAA family ATPase [Planctomycetota bacterium]
MRTMAVANQKGGCGKTTVSINLAACLAEAGKSVLLVDMDPQGHCALGLSVPEEQIEFSVADVLLQDQSGGPVEMEHATWQISSNFDFLPATLGLVRFESVTAKADNREQYLKSALGTVAHRYDYCIIDCPPHVGLLTYNALAAADDAVIPVETGYFALQGLQKQIDTVRDLIARTGQDLKIRVLANSYDVRTKLAREILNEMRRKFDDLMFKSYVNFNTKLKESASFGQAITEYDPSSMGCRDFVRLAKEIIETEVPLVSHEDLLVQANRLAAKAEALLASKSVLITHVPQTAESNVPQAVTSPDDDIVEVPSDASGLDHAEIARKIIEVYGIRQTPDGVEFHTKVPSASEVLIAGDFNSWSPQNTPMIRQGADGHFKADLTLPKGRYRYRLVVDGRWTRDPCNTVTEMNEFGELNSVIEIT